MPSPPWKASTCSFSGPGDFSHAIGCAGELNAPPVVEARRMVAAARRAGTASSPARWDRPKPSRRWLISATSSSNIGADVLFLVSGFSRVVQTFSPSGKNHKD